MTPPAGGPPVALTHYFTHYRSMGGVQSILRRHLESDARWGLQSNVTAFFDPRDAQPAGVHGLGFTGFTCLAEARQRFRTLPEGDRRPVAMYHNGWGLPFFADLDRADRRLMLFHSDWPGITTWLPSLAGLVDGILCVSETLRELAASHLPGLGPERLALAPVPIGDGPALVARSPLAGRPLVVGFNARLAKAQKRVDRLPALVQACRANGLNFRLELLGEGPEQAWLRRQFANASEVVFHGRLGGEAYWRTLAGWDVILFTSDYEGLPIALLEAMHAGAIPVYPRIQSGGDRYAENIRPDLLYPAGAVEAAARTLQTLSGLPTGELDELRARARQLASAHAGGAYQDAFAGFVRRMRTLPRVSASRFAPRPRRWTDYCPFGVLSRYFPSAYTRSAPPLA